MTRSPTARAPFALAIVMCGTNLATPLYGGYQDRLGLTPVTLAVVFAIYFAAIVPGLAALGKLADAVGRRGVVAGALVVGAVASAVMAAAGGLGGLLAGRVLAGLSFAAGVGAGTAMIAESEPRQPERAARLATAAMLCGTALGPLLTGVLAQYAPAPYVLGYAVHVALCALALLALAGCPETLPAALRRPWGIRRPALPGGSISPFLVASFAGALAGLLGALFLAVVPLYAREVIGSESLAVHGAIAALYLVSGAVVQRLADPAPPERAVVAGLACVTASLVLLVVAHPLGSTAVLGLAAIVGGVGQGRVWAGALSRAAALAPADARADVLATYWAIVYGLGGAAIVGFGIVSAAGGVFAALCWFAGAVGCAALAAAALVVSPAAARRRR